ncbi:MAG: BON domain-containing protein [Thermoguttaceae bacterium]
MLRKQVVPDKVIVNKVTQRLGRAGLGAGCTVRVSVKNGQVTLSGTIQRDLQRRPALRAATGIDGVRQVIDQLKVEVKKPKLEPKKPKLEPPKTPAAAQIPDAPQVPDAAAETTAAEGKLPPPASTAPNAASVQPQ